MNDMMSDDKFAQMFADPEAEKVANEPSTMERIQADFEQSFASVKDKLGDSWQDVRTLYDMARDQTFAMDTKVKVVVIGALAYLVSPVDLLPERVLGPIGLTDDVAVLYFALKFAQPEIARYKTFKFETGGHS
jgi:uncharacterized membrane protein YkvA (DUF1232 family)